MKRLFLLTLSAFAAPENSPGAAPLNSYTHLAADLPMNEVSEASTLCYNRDTDTVFTIGDEGEAISEYGTDGSFKSKMSLLTRRTDGSKALVDSEGLAYLGNSRFMIADERPMTGLIATYIGGTTAAAGDFPSVSIDPLFAGNSNNGLEGICYDPVTDTVWGVKEHTPFAIYQISGFDSPTPVVTKPFAAQKFNKLGYLHDISDIFIMANSQHFAAEDPRRMNLLILSQEDNLILEMTRAGEVVDTLNIAFVGRHTIEGITMDDQGTIYLASEQGPPPNVFSGLHVLTPPPLAVPFSVTSCAIAGPEESVTASVTWNATAGRQYVIEFSETLADTDWQAVSSVATATGTTHTMETQPLPRNGKGFFRVKEVTP
ncbi:SdiA-regulated domain-containing protein [Luteolibacter luteus]|uniref:Uncharacterized protein n=1 Tax=Luteolibacter luteus TaxID=2728835 RepID=A0A858RPD4_9BACT|nr:SdiA-regulated domain-containing protein [Luteolibacter luteus]QJE97980.1 hypothetical protein HHL09_20040 [Luteolibacter luteus]